MGVQTLTISNGMYEFKLNCKSSIPNTRVMLFIMYPQLTNLLHINVIFGDYRPAELSIDIVNCGFVTAGVSRV